MVSDGHGQEDYVRSDRGAKYACEAALEAADEFLSGTLVVNDSLDNPLSKEQDTIGLWEHTVPCTPLKLAGSGMQNQVITVGHQEEIIKQLCKNILVRWNAKVLADYLSDPFSEKEVKDVSEKYRHLYLQGKCCENAYGTTLQLAILTRHFFLAIRNGDGECITLDAAGNYHTPIPRNDICEAGFTTSLSDDTALEDFRHILLFKHQPDFPVAVFLDTDGVDNSYINLNGLYALYRNITRRVLTVGAARMASEMNQTLSVLTQKGSMDDVSIAGIFDMDKLSSVFEIQ